MDRILKVFLSGQRQDEFAERHEVVARYDAFVVVRVAAADAQSIMRDFLVEDITDQYAISLGGQVNSSIDVSAPRITGRGTTVAHPAYPKAKRLVPGPHHYLVQFVGPVKPEWLETVRKAGGEVVDTHSGFTVVVRATQPQISRIAGLPEVRWAGHLPPAARLDVADPDSRPLPRTRLLPDTLSVEFFTPREARKARTEVRRLGLKISADESAAGILVVDQPQGAAAARRRQLDALSQIHGVRMVRRRAVNRISNDVAVGVVKGDAASLNGGPALDGSGEIVGICDTGLDVGGAAPHPDFAGRVKWVKELPDCAGLRPVHQQSRRGRWRCRPDSGHGTHVAGSAVGDGAAGTALPGRAAIRAWPTGRGLVFQAVERPWTGRARPTCSATAVTCWPGFPPT